MSWTHETSPYSGQPDEFDLLVGELHEQLTDPFVADIHLKARLAEADLRRDSTHSNRARLIDYLDKEWGDYINRYVEIIGTAYVRLPGKPEVEARTLTGQPVKSLGFTFCTVDSPQGEAVPTVAHQIGIEDGDTRMQGFVMLDDLDILRLPYPSPEQRIRQFAYHQPYLAEYIDELAYTSGRPDQIIKSLGEFTIQLDPANSQDVQTALDAQEYLRRAAALEPYANYEIAVKGPLTIVTEDGELVPTESKLSRPCIMALQSIDLCPPDITRPDSGGVQECVPVVTAVVFSERGDRQIVLPCSSIASIRSLRYRSTV